MIDTFSFYNSLKSNNIDFFAGVPDSLLADFCSCIYENTPSEKNIITANEGNAVAMCGGYHISSGKYGLVYMQNSGLGNAINPLLSLVDEEIYSLPMLLVIGWRGEPDKHDEPQHIKQGKLTIPLLNTMSIKYLILDDLYETQIDYCISYMKEYNKPIALIVKKGIFSKYSFNFINYNFELTREIALEVILNNLTSDDFIVSTTGKTSREIFEIRERNNQDHSNDFLTVGSMGHTASIAFGMSLGTNKNIYCIDGDGSFIMHMGSMGIIGNSAPSNFKYILNNNGAHESVGGQPTCAFSINIPDVLKDFGFKYVHTANNINEINESLRLMKNETSTALVIYTKQGSRKDLGRPSIEPVQNKKMIMKKFGAK